MKILARLTFGVLATVAATSTASAEVHLTMQNGHVTLVAKNATVRQILTEWERVGQTKAVNVDRSQDVPLNLELTDVPEQQALDIVLRSVSGVLLAPRREAAAGNVSAFAQIILMPPSTLPPPPAAPTPTPQPPTFGQPGYVPSPYPLQPPQQLPQGDDERSNGPPQRPAFVFPQPQIVGPQTGQPTQLAAPAGNGAAPAMMAPFPQPGAPTGATPAPATAFPGVPASTAPGGVSVPGMIVPAPQPQPTQPLFQQPPLQPQNP